MSATIRVTEIADAQAICDIYNYYVDNTVVTFVTERQTADDYARKIEHIKERYPFLVAEENGAVIGFCYADRMRPHDAYRWDVELTIYLRADAPKRRGTGRALYAAMFRLLKRQGFRNAYAVITVPNEASVGLQEAFGLHRIALFENTGYKRGAWRDVVWMVKELGAFDPEPEPPAPFAALSPDEVRAALNA